MANVSYNELWTSKWGDMQHWGPVHRHSMKVIYDDVAALPNVRTILDAGCGSGENLAVLERANKWELTGSDFSEEALKLSSKCIPSVRLVQLDVEQNHLPETFDLVMSHQVIEHIIDDIAAIKNMAKMSKRYVYVSSMQGRMRKSERTIGHYRNYSPWELARKLEAAGLRVIWIKGWGFPFYSPLYRTVVEWLPGGPPTGKITGATRLVARFLYQLYKLNIPNKGDYIYAMAEHPSPQGGEQKKA